MKVRVKSPVEHNQVLYPVGSTIDMPKEQADPLMSIDVVEDEAVARAKEKGGAQVSDAQAKADEILNSANEQAEQIVREAKEKATKIEQDARAKTARTADETELKDLQTEAKKLGVDDKGTKEELAQRVNEAKNKVKA